MSKVYIFGVLAVLLLCSTVAPGQVFFTANLTGAQEVPPVTTTARGTGWAVLSADMTTLSYSVTFARLSAARTASHFHIGVPGVIGAVVQPITFTGNTATGSWTNLPDSTVRHLLRGNVYMNIHTSPNPNGEIRGVLTLAQGVGFPANLDGSQEVPPVTTGAKGTGWAILDSSGARLTYQATIAGLTVALSASHFHLGPPGVISPVVRPITFGADSTASGVWSGVPDSVLTGLAKGNVYFNVHTSPNPNGEIRGQLIRTVAVSFTANMTGAQEVPPVTTNARGTLWAVLSSDMTRLDYAITYARLSAARTASHFHIGVPGVIGAVVQSISFTGNNSVGSWTNLPDSTVRHLFKGNVYANIHTSPNPNGEIRGVLTLAQGVSFSANADGSQEVPPVTTGAKGTVWAVLDSGAARLNYQVTIAGLPTALTASHFHFGSPGVIGPVVRPIAFGSDSTASGIWSGVPDSLVTGLLKGNLYFNAHTSPNPNGEIRGHLKFGPNIVTSVKPISEAVPTSFKLEQNYPNPFNPSTKIGFRLPAGQAGITDYGLVRLKVYDVLGREVSTLVNEVMKPGSYEVSFNASGLASGVYFYRLQVGNAATKGFVQTQKMLLVK